MNAKKTPPNLSKIFFVFYYIALPFVDKSCNDFNSLRQQKQLLNSQVSGFMS